MRSRSAGGASGGVGLPADHAGGVTGAVVAAEAGGREDVPLPIPGQVGGGEAQVAAPAVPFHDDARDHEGMAQEDLDLPPGAAQQRAQARGGRAVRRGETSEPAQERRLLVGGHGDGAREARLG